MRRVYLEERPLEEARRGYWRFLGDVVIRREEKVAARESAGRVTSRPVYAALSSPHYHASAMDGVAVRARDTVGASPTRPLRLGPARQVDTGDPLPSDADAVIMIEDVHWVGEGDFEITKAAVPWQHVRPVGEDVVAGDMVLPSNRRIGPAEVGALLSAGVVEVPVRARPRVAIIPTGTELIRPEDVQGTPPPGAVLEFNSAVMAAAVGEAGGEPLVHEAVPDDYPRLREALERAAREADLLLVNAGSSAGREDYTRRAVEDLGGVFCHGVAIKPGKPVLLGEVKGVPCIGVPGYPVSAELVVRLFVVPLIHRMLGLPAPEPRTVRAVLTRPVTSSAGVREYLRVGLGKVGERLVALPLGRGAGLINSLARADGLACIPERDDGLPAGAVVEVELRRDPGEVERTLLVVGSHDITLDVLGDRLRSSYPGCSLTSANVGSVGGLLALRRGEAHMAGCHLLDEETGQYNLSFVRRYLPGREVVLVHLAYREQGLMVAPGNPKGIRGVEDLVREDVTIVNRQRGAGTRVLLDHLLAGAGISPQEVRGYDRQEFTHTAVAAAVASGSADCGLGIRAAARALGLDFVPLTEEPYELAVPRERYEDEVVQRALEVITPRDFARAVEALGGYSLRDTGKERVIGAD